MKEVYLVLFDGVSEGEYGTMVSLLGVYDSQKKAEKALNTLPEELRARKWSYEIKKTVLNDTLDVIRDPYGNYKTSIECGHYLE